MEGVQCLLTITNLKSKLSSKVFVLFREDLWSQLFFFQWNLHFCFGLLEYLDLAINSGFSFLSVYIAELNP